MQSSRQDPKPRPPAEEHPIYPRRTSAAASRHGARQDESQRAALLITFQTKEGCCLGVWDIRQHEGKGHFGNCIGFMSVRVLGKTKLESRRSGLGVRGLEPVSEGCWTRRDVFYSNRKYMFSGNHQVKA